MTRYVEINLPEGWGDLSVIYREHEIDVVQHISNQSNWEKTHLNSEEKSLQDMIDYFLNSTDPVFDPPFRVRELTPEEIAKLPA